MHRPTPEANSQSQKTKLNTRPTGVARNSLNFRSAGGRFFLKKREMPNEESRLDAFVRIPASAPRKRAPIPELASARDAFSRIAFHALDDVTARPISTKNAPVSSLSKNFALAVPKLKLSSSAEDDDFDVDFVFVFDFPASPAVELLEVEEEEEEEEDEEEEAEAPASPAAEGSALPVALV